MITVAVCYLLAPEGNIMNLFASLIGVSALIFVAKGYVIGQILLVVFSIFYGIISFGFKYYGEMITYLGMSAPIAILSVVSWLRHPYGKTDEVEVSRVSRKSVIAVSILTVIVTVAFYFILEALGTENLFFSTVSVTTSFAAASLTFLRSPYYALGYACNDIVLIVLWVLATVEDISYLPMIVCFAVFFVNDMYGFINWQRMKRRQNKAYYAQ